MGAFEGLTPDMALLSIVLTEGIVVGEAAPPEITVLDRQAANEINNILTHREDVYESFRIGDLPRPYDLQQERIAHLQEQRIDLLRTLHLEEAAEAMRDPQIYFEGITSQFFEECGRDRRVYSRAHYIDAHTLTESAYTGTFRRNDLGVIEPELQARIGFITQEIDGVQSSDPRFFEVVTDLQGSKPGFRYSFYDSAVTGLRIVEQPADGYREDVQSMEITDPIDRFTLLQALTVDMQSALRNRQPQNDTRACSLIAHTVYGSRNF